MKLWRWLLIVPKILDILGVKRHTVAGKAGEVAKVVGEAQAGESPKAPPGSKP